MSVRKRRWTTAKGVEKEAWIVDYMDGQGVRRLKTFHKKKDAGVFAATANVEVREGTHIADSASVRVSKAGDLWIAGAEGGDLEQSTVDQYRQHLDLHIKPFIGEIKLSQLAIATVRAFEERLRAGDLETVPPQPPRSPAMIRKVLGSLGSMLADAQERGLAARNVVRDMRGRRRRGKDRQADRRQKGRLRIGVDIPTRGEIKAIVEHVDGRWRPLLITAIFSGLRASELRGLRWCDVDLARREIHVRQRADRFNEIGPPKSAAGYRTVPLPPIVVNTLREWQLTYPRPLTGERDGDDKPMREPARPEHLVFPNGAGKVESLANIINRGLIPPQLAAGIVDEDGRAHYTGMHVLRHWYASWCINGKPEGLELPPKAVQERLGHSSITMTMDTYGHMFPRGDDAAELEAAEKALLA